MIGAELLLDSPAVRSRGDAHVPQAEAAPTIAAVTMVYNEADLLPIWLRHYRGQVGAAHCYVIDHGSDDGSTRELGETSVLRLPRSPQDDARRAAMVADFCGGLLHYYDAVLHTDVDELVVADPCRFAGLRDCAGAMAGDTLTAIGLELVQVAEREAAIEAGRGVLAQRRWVRFNSALCKPVLTRRKLAWAPGFHCADTEIRFGALYLFHLRYFDLARGLRRLAKTRAMPWACAAAAPHQRMDDASWQALFAAMAGVPRLEGIAFDPEAAPLKPWLDAVRASRAGRDGATYTLDLGLVADRLWAVPPQFAGSF